MTVQEFAKKVGRSEATVIGWFVNGFIPGATRSADGVITIPQNAMEPYVEAKAKGGLAAYRSILRGCIKGKAVFPALYHMSEEVFRTYVDQWIALGYVIRKEIDGVTYYYPGVKCMEINDYTKTGLERGLSRAVAALKPSLETADLLRKMNKSA